MSKKQKFPIAPPLSVDKENFTSFLADLTSVIQRNLEDLFFDAHLHDIRTSAPANTDGNIKDILIVNLSGTYYLYVKVAPTLWKRVVLS